MMFAILNYSRSKGMHLKTVKFLPIYFVALISINYPIILATSFRPEKPPLPAMTFQQPNKSIGAQIDQNSIISIQGAQALWGYFKRKDLFSLQRTLETYKNPNATNPNESWNDDTLLEYITSTPFAGSNPSEESECHCFLEKVVTLFAKHNANFNPAPPKPPLLARVLNHHTTKELAPMIALYVKNPLAPIDSDDNSLLHVLIQNNNEKLLEAFLHSCKQTSLPITNLRNSSGKSPIDLFFDTHQYGYVPRIILASKCLLEYVSHTEKKNIQELIAERFDCCKETNRSSHNNFDDEGFIKMVGDVKNFLTIFFSKKPQLTKVSKEAIDLLLLTSCPNPYSSSYSVRISSLPPLTDNEWRKAFYLPPITIGAEVISTKPADGTVAEKK